MFINPICGLSQELLENFWSLFNFAKVTEVLRLKCQKRPYGSSDEV